MVSIKVAALIACHQKFIILNLPAESMLIQALLLEAKVVALQAHYLDGVAFAITEEIDMSGEWI